MPKNVSVELGNLLVQGYSLSDIYVEYPEEWTTMEFTGLKTKYCKVSDYEATIVMTYV